MNKSIDAYAARVDDDGMQEQKTAVKTVGEIPLHYKLLQDSQDIDATLEIIGKTEMRSEVGCLFVEVGEGDYGAVYMCEKFIPYLAERVTRIY